ncbi:hypothetical protein D3C84_1214820 [compost metagenome]
MVSVWSETVRNHEEADSRKYPLTIKSPKITKKVATTADAVLLIMIPNISIKAE